MQKLLNQSEVALIDARLHDNALYQACREVWPGRQDEITSVMARSEDIFCESAYLMDELIGSDEDVDAICLAHGLWSKVVFDIGQWNNGITLADRYLIISTIFRTVALSFSLHWNSHYCGVLRDALLSVVDEKRPSPKDLPNHQQYERQQEELLEAIIPCSQILNDWVNEYIDNPSLCLTDEIDNALNKQLNIKHGKSERRKVDKKPIIRQRMTWNVEKITHSFCYTTRSMPAEEKNKRLSIFFKLLNNKYISHTDMTTFFDIFSGVETSRYIVWRGYIVELQYFIETLITKGLITWSRPAPGKWQIVCARFRIEHYVKEDDFEANSEKQSMMIDSLEPSQFNKIPKANKLNKHDILDKIISILVEESDAERINREVAEMFAKMETSEKETAKSQSQIKPIDY